MIIDQHAIADYRLHLRNISIGLNLRNEESKHGCKQ